MPSLADILPATAQVKIDSPGGSTILVEYRPGMITTDQLLAVADMQKREKSGEALVGEFQALLSEFLSETIVSWDLTDNDAKQWPLDPPSLRKLPQGVLWWVFNGINDDESPADEGESQPSAAG